MIRKPSPFSFLLIVIIALTNYPLVHQFVIEVPYIIIETNPAESTPLDIKDEIVQEQQSIKQPVKQGQTNGKIVLERIMAYPNLGQGDAIVLRNIGGQTVNLSGWNIRNSLGRTLYDFGSQRDCDNLVYVDPMCSIEITRITKKNECGFVFGLSFQDNIFIFDEKNNLIAEARWESSIKGSAIRLIHNRYIQISETINVFEILQQIDEFSSFRWALSVVGLDKFLMGESNPNYQLPSQPAPPTPTYQPQFPWWFGFAVDRETLSPPPSPPPPPPPPPFGQVSQIGPYTIFAPTNKAFAELEMQLTRGESKITLQRFLNLPEAKDILLYHIYYGMYTTSTMYNNTDITSSLGPNLFISKDASQTEGFIALNDACVDKPTRGFPCTTQREFGKCFDPLMLSVQASGWRGGFCQKTCQRCSCKEADGGACSKIIIPDLRASNGIVHGIDRLLFPPPLFQNDNEEEDEDLAPDMEDMEAELDFGLPVEYELKRSQYQYRGL